MALRTLITGGAGFVGSRLAEALVRRGDHVVVFDNLVAAPGLRLLEGIASEIEFCHGDIRCSEDFERISPGGFDLVFHLASSFANQLSIEQPRLDFHTNVDGTHHVTDFARKRGSDLLVFTGTSSSYGSVSVPFTENGPMNPETPYASSKRKAEDVVRTSGCDWAVFRLFNVYGPGDYPGRYRNVIPNVMQAAATERQCLRITGASATRDFNYIDDVIRILANPAPARGHTVNIGTGVETNVASLIREVQRMFGVPDERVSIELPREWDSVVRRCASVELLHKLYGRQSPVPLDVGLKRTAAWLSTAGFIERSPS